MREISNCKKEKHWIWYIFPSGKYIPQQGKRISNTNIYFQLHNRRMIKNRPEYRENTLSKYKKDIISEPSELLVNEIEIYLLNPILINRIYNISETLYDCLINKKKKYYDIFPNDDHKKLLSSMKIFNEEFKKMGIDLFEKIIKELNNQGLN